MRSQMTSHCTGGGENVASLSSSDRLAHFRMFPQNHDFKTKLVKNPVKGLEND